MQILYAMLTMPRNATNAIYQCKIQTRMQMQNIQTILRDEHIREHFPRTSSLLVPLYHVSNRQSYPSIHHPLNSPLSNPSHHFQYPPPICSYLSLRLTLRLIIWSSSPTCSRTLRTRLSIRPLLLLLKTILRWSCSN